MSLTRARARTMARTLVLVGLAGAAGGCQELIDEALGTLTIDGRVGTIKGEPVEGAMVAVYSVTDILLASPPEACTIHPREYDSSRSYDGCAIIYIGTTLNDSTYRLQIDQFPSPLGSARTGADGTYSIADVGKNLYIVVARKQQYTPGIAGMDRRTGQINETSAVAPATADAVSLQVNLMVAGGPVAAPPPDPAVGNVGQGDDAEPTPEPELPEPEARQDECQTDEECEAVLGGAPPGFTWLCEPGTDGVNICTGVESTDQGCTADAECDDGDPSNADYCLPDGTCGHCQPSEPDPEELEGTMDSEWERFQVYDFSETELADASMTDAQITAFTDLLMQEPIMMVRGRLLNASSDHAFVRVQTGASSCSNQEPTTELIQVRLDGEGNIVSEKGDFQELPLTGGYQVFQLASDDTAAARVSHLLTVGTRCQLPPFEIQVIMSWSTDGDDVDLHVWNAAGEETASFGARNSSYGSVDIDDVSGYGPEVFTANEGHLGDSYSVRVRYYRGANQPVTTVRVIQSDGASCLRDDTFTVQFGAAREWIEVGNFTPATICAMQE